MISGVGTPWQLVYRYGDQKDGGLISVYTIAWLRGLRERKALNSMPTSLEQQPNAEEIRRRSATLIDRIFLGSNNYLFYGALIECGNVIVNVPRYLDIEGNTHVMIPQGSVMRTYYGSYVTKEPIMRITDSFHLAHLQDALMAKRKMWERILTDIEELYKGI